MYGTAILPSLNTLLRAVKEEITGKMGEKYLSFRGGKIIVSCLCMH